MTRGTGNIHFQTLIFFILSKFDTSIQTQQNSASDTFMGANNVSPDGLDQSINHNGNRYVQDNDDSQSYKTHKKSTFFLFW